MNESNALKEVVSNMVELNNLQNGEDATVSLDNILKLGEDGVFAFAEEGRENLQKLK
jgi:hypothetical protein